jgi:hypothetical protein
MKKLFFLLILSAPAYLASAQDRNTPYLTRSLSADAVKNVFLKTSGGSISVSGAEGQQPRLEVYITGNNGQNYSKEEIKKRLEEDFILDITVQNNELRATARAKRNFNWKRALSIGFKVYVSRQTATNLNTSGGSISIDNLSGNQNFGTSGGSLNVDRVTGIIKGETSGGSIHVSNSKQDIDLNTSGGSVTASNCQGRIKLETSGGSLNLNNLKGTINATTSGGSINGSNVDGELITGTSGGSVNLNAISGSLDASTSGGSIHAQLLRVSKYVKLETSAGHVDLELPVKQSLNLDLRGDRVTVDMDGTFSGSKEKEKVIGKVNGGGPVVEVRGDSRVSVSTK